jgi:hypothetical protein
MGREESVQPVAKADADNRVRVTDDASHEPVGAHT